MPNKGEVIFDDGRGSTVRFVSNEELAAQLAARTPEEIKSDRRDARLMRRFNRACDRAEPHWAHPDDIEDIADEILNKWFRRAVRFGDEIVALERLHRLPDTRD